MCLELEFFLLLLIRNSTLLIVALKDERYLYSFLAIIDEPHTLKIRVKRK